MPIYEYYCPACHTVLQFFSKKVNSTARPACPHCGRENLEKEISTFAMSRGGGANEEGDMPPFSEEKLAGAMETLAREAEGIREDDPKQAAQLMRKFSRLTGVKMGESMEEALRRMEAGEDPDQIEEELGDSLAEEDPFGLAGEQTGARSTRSGRGAPRRDPKLYEL